MTLKRRAFWSVALVAAYIAFISVWSSFVPQIQADIALEQMKNDDVAYGIGRAAANWNLEGWFFLVTCVLLMAVWAPVLYRGIFTDSPTLESSNAS
jgi:hypothetical protein